MIGTFTETGITWRDSGASGVDKPETGTRELLERWKALQAESAAIVSEVCKRLEPLP